MPGREDKGRQSHADLFQGSRNDGAPSSCFRLPALAQIYLGQSRPEEALLEVEQEPEPTWRLYGLALVQHSLGNRAAAEAALAKIIEDEGDVSGFQIAELYAWHGDADHAFEWLERAYGQRDGGLSQMKGDPFLKNVTG